jgi:hypothetical protein
MASKRLAALQSGLESASGKRPAATPAKAIVGTAEAKPATAASRAGQIHLGAWLSPDFKKSLMLAQIKTGLKQHELIREAFNDLFAKHDVPVIDM